MSAEVIFFAIIFAGLLAILAAFAQLIFSRTSRAIKSNLKPLLVRDEVVEEVVIFSIKVLPAMADAVLHMVSPVVIKDRLIIAALTNERLFFVEAQYTISQIIPMPKTLNSIPITLVYRIEYEPDGFGYKLLFDTVQGAIQYYGDNDWKFRAKRMSEKFLRLKYQK